MHPSVDHVLTHVIRMHITCHPDYLHVLINITQIPQIGPKTPFWVKATSRDFAFKNRIGLKVNLPSYCHTST